MQDLKCRNCGNCGAPIEDEYKCSYCKSLFDRTMNILNNMAFTRAYPVNSISTMCYNNLSTAGYYSKDGIPWR